ncbi:dihydrofolate reductase family protein [Aquihabitans sp. G128]|uniref:dihydrofolate reductase family protein n=1 Tax=Aquihabitans sp. G128 TaxID=2849779 RepID=UPI001C2244B6|nr:dihydrofolate reductase family protein [Aquihabitans sp. G128]QXC60889.1 dihydrofolate reductase family protein [Aquihabitans sp. G128]
MPKLRAHNISMSLDGFAAGPDQDEDNPLGVGGRALHEWAFATPSGRAMFGGDPPELTPGLEVDEAWWRAGDEGIGATIMGRNMFGPVRGPWPDHSWTGWWGPEPPYHHPVFVLTHHVRPALELDGTTFHFVDGGIEAALELAFAAADGADVRVGGGASTVRQYLAAELLDDLHVAIAPLFLGRGERIFDDPAGLAGYGVTEVVQGAGATHVRIAKGG